MSGIIKKISGPTVVARDVVGAKMYDLVNVGKAGLVGEIIQLERNLSTIQVYEDTTGLAVGEKVTNTESPLMVELGPGLMANIFDGIQRPLEEIRKATGTFIGSTSEFTGLAREKLWRFVPKVEAGQDVQTGDIIGVVQETPTIEHRIMIPIGTSGTIREIAEGEYRVDQVVASLEDGTELTLMQRCPVRKARPCKEKLSPETPFLTGQRVFDTIFPIAMGGTAVIPGGFGTGKTVVQQTLAKFSNAEVIIYVGCGERGNEMTEVLTEFPELTDPSADSPLMNRTILVVNTSNMPVAAREASIYTGITLAEYYRDMGYSVAMMVDSTSRWAEALREISSRLEEMPGEEGYPTYMSSRLSDFYERAGRVRCFGSDDRTGAVTIVGAISPPGGDFSEPVTQASLRISGAFWALDSSLAQRRHFPSVNWNQSYSLYVNELKSWFGSRIARDWDSLRNQMILLLQKELELQAIVQVVGLEGLSESEQMVLEICRMLQEDYLQQNAFHDVDCFCQVEKQYRMLKLLLLFYEKGMQLLQTGESLERILANPIRAKLSRIKESPFDDFHEEFEQLLEGLNNLALS
ncbi:MAG: V-type ATP synthase subunit A [bacterium]|nr:V-type ATP synthase subunit A [bacterium]